VFAVTSGRAAFGITKGACVWTRRAMVGRSRLVVAAAISSRLPRSTVGRRGHKVRAQPSVRFAPRCRTSGTSPLAGASGANSRLKHSGTESEELAAAVRPVGPLLGDRHERVDLAMTLRAADKPSSIVVTGSVALRTGRFKRRRGRRTRHRQHGIRAERFCRAWKGLFASHERVHTPDHHGSSSGASARRRPGTAGSERALD
jgi:hypothetical protein